MPGPDIEGAGQALLLLQHRVVAAIKEILQRPAHVAQVFRGAEKDAVGLQHILRGGFQRCHPAHLHILDGVRAGPTYGGIAQQTGVFRRGVGDDQQMPFGHAHSLRCGFRGLRPV